MFRRTHSLYFIGTVVALVLGGTAVQAQSERTPGPSPKMRKLQFLIGKWVGKGKRTQGKEDIPLTETIEAHWALGGTYIEAASTYQEGQNPPAGALSLTTFDPQAKVYRCWWFAQGGQLQPPVTATFDGDRLVFSWRDPPAPMEGIGAQLAPKPSPEGYTVIGSLLTGTPAAKAGLKGGDSIARVDGRSVVGLSVDQVVDLLHGKAGSTVHLTVRSGGKERQVSFTRAKFLVQSPGMRQVFDHISKSEFSDHYESKVGDHYERSVDFGETRFTAVP